MQAAVTARSLWLELAAALSPTLGLTEARAIATRLVEHCLGLTRTDVLLDQPLTRSQPDWAPLLARLQAHEPLQYVLGEADFYGKTFVINPSVLIPRPETEELVEWVLHDFSGKATDVLDVGTGSGCIACTLAAAWPQARLQAWDVSAPALAVAVENAQKQGVRVAFRLQDVLQEDLTAGPLDVLISNPPYIAAAEAPALLPNVREYEPQMALFVPDTDPLVFYKALARLARRSLRPGGAVYVEINQRLGQPTRQVFEQAGLACTELRQDISGNDRLLKAQA